MAKNVRYTEPADYFPPSIRKEMGIGEFEKNDKSADKKKPAKPSSKKTGKK